MSVGLQSRHYFQEFSTTCLQFRSQPAYDRLRGRSRRIQLVSTNQLHLRNPECLAERNSALRKPHFFPAAKCSKSLWLFYWIFIAKSLNGD